MNTSEVNLILESIKNNSGNNQAVLILQGITLTVTLLKPIFMYWIQAKYNASAPHESIRSFRLEDHESLPLNTQSDEYGYIPGDDGNGKYIGIDRCGKNIIIKRDDGDDQHFSNKRNEGEEDIEEDVDIML